jgi:uncharacterized membrane protein
LSARLVVSLDRRILRVARHWLPIANAIVAGWFVAVLLAPLLRAAGSPALARPIYALFSVLCHQDPNRSFAVGGHPLACCHRCAAIYGASAAAGLGYATLRGKLRPARPYELAALLVPVVVDVLGGMAGLWESTTVSRLATGTLAGLALVWLLYPYLDAGFTRIQLRLESLFTRLAAEGRFQ